jgi:hypothetical protein
VYWGVAGFRHGGEELLESVERRVQRLARTYQPELIVVEKPTKLRLAASWSLPAIVNRIRETVLRSGLQLRIYDQDTVRNELCGSAWATRHELAERIVELYPHLGRYTDCASEWKQSYWLAMFAAVAVGVVCGRDCLIGENRPSCGGGEAR